MFIKMFVQSNLNFFNFRHSIGNKKGEKRERKREKKRLERKKNRQKVQRLIDGLALATKDVVQGERDPVYMERVEELPFPRNEGPRIEILLFRRKRIQRKLL